MQVIFNILLVIGVIAFVYIKYKKGNKIRNLKTAYEEALRGTDKQAALAAGRAYYGSLRKNGLLTIYDETALTNDISTMKVER